MVKAEGSGSNTFSVERKAGTSRKSARHTVIPGPCVAVYSAFVKCQLSLGQRLAKQSVVAAYAAFNVVYGFSAMIATITLPSWTDVGYGWFVFTWLAAALNCTLALIGIFGIVAAIKRSTILCRVYFFLTFFYLVFGSGPTWNLFRLQCNCTSFRQCSALESFAAVYDREFTNPYPAPPSNAKFADQIRIAWKFPPDSEYFMAGMKGPKGSSLMETPEVNSTGTAFSRHGTRHIDQAFPQASTNSNQAFGKSDKDLRPSLPSGRIGKLTRRGGTGRGLVAIETSEVTLVNTQEKVSYAPQATYRDQGCLRSAKGELLGNGCFNETSQAGNRNVTPQSVMDLKQPPKLEGEPSTSEQPPEFEGEWKPKVSDCDMARCVQSTEFKCFKEQEEVEIEKCDPANPLAGFDKVERPCNPMPEHCKHESVTEDGTVPKLSDLSKSDTETGTPDGTETAKPNGTESDEQDGDDSEIVPAPTMDEKKFDPNADGWLATGMVKPAAVQAKMPFDDWVAYMRDIKQHMCTCAMDSRSCYATQEDPNSETGHNIGYWCKIDKKDKEKCEKGTKPRVKDLKTFPKDPEHLWTRGICQKDRKKQVGREAVNYGKCKCKKEMGYHVEGAEFETVRSAFKNEAKGHNLSSVFIGYRCDKWYHTDHMKNRRWCTVGFDTACADRKERIIDSTTGVRVWTSSIPCEKGEADTIIQKASGACLLMKAILFPCDLLRYALLPFMWMAVFAWLQVGCRDKAGGAKQKLTGWGLGDSAGESEEGGESDSDDDSGSGSGSDSEAEAKSKAKAKPKSIKGSSQDSPQKPTSKAKAPGGAISFGGPNSSSDEAPAKLAKKGKK